MSEQLEESLRHEIESYIEGRFSAIRQEIAGLQNQLNESLNHLLERQTEVQMDGSLAASIIEHLRAAHAAGVDLAAAESSRAKASSEMAIIKAGIEEINQQQSQADVLKILISRAASFAPRVSFFVIKGDQATGWRARGFEGTVGDKAIQQISLSISDDTVIGNVARSKTTWSGGPGSHSEDHLLLNRLGDEPPQRIVAIPLMARNRAVAVLYADSAGLDSEAINLEALETLARVSGMAVELLSISRAPAKPAAAESVEEPVREPAPSYTPSREYEEPAAAAVDEYSFESDAMPAESMPQPEPMATVMEAASEPMQSESSGLLSSPEPPPPPPPTTRRYGSMDAELPVPVSNDEERRLHNDARRFARLLVSEIKLYNEQKVADGRSHGDLYNRLREYIDRSREMYDKRVKPEVASRYDYFHQEIVNTLAEGDVSKLGAGYPGATVPA